jgi:hypothetical protein
VPSELVPPPPPPPPPPSVIVIGPTMFDGTVNDPLDVNVCVTHVTALPARYAQLSATFVGAVFRFAAVGASESWTTCTVECHVAEGVYGFMIRLRSGVAKN